VSHRLIKLTSVLAMLACVGSALAAPPPSTTAPTPTGDNVAASNLSTAASGDLEIAGDQHAKACQTAAQIGDLHGTGVDECTQALASPLLHEHDLAATLTDRGAIRMQHRQFDLAVADFDAALRAEPGVANIYINRGGALIALKRYAEAIADIDRGLALGPDQPEKAWFNRAIADEHLKDLKAAYQDYLKASQLNPTWEAPKGELARFGPPPAP
jgi:tetratricopeptide (TPR) repeat protein